MFIIFTCFLRTFPDIIVVVSDYSLLTTSEVVTGEP